MLRRPPRSTRTDTLFPTRRSSDLKAAEDADWDTEYLDSILSARVVDGLSEAMSHINTHGSHHTDAIVTENAEKAEAFLNRSEEHTSELQSLMRISYAVFCLKKKKTTITKHTKKKKKILHQHHTKQIIKLIRIQKSTRRKTT